MQFDESKWNAILQQWADDDKGEAADQADVAQLHDPKSWTALDDKLRLRKAFDDVGVNPETPDAPAATEVAQPKAPVPMAEPEAPKPPASISAPPKMSAPSDIPYWGSLAARLEAAERSRGQAQAAENMFANVGAISGYHPNTHAGDADVALAKLPLEMAEKRQAFEGSQAKLNAATAQAAASQAEKDPNSDVSRRSREAFKAFFGTSGLLPPNVDTLTAADIKQFTSGDLLPLMKLKSAKDIAGEKTKAADTALAQEKAAMKMQYKDNPELFAQIDASPSIDALGKLQTAQEGRLGRASTQGHADEARKQSEDFQTAQQARSEAFQKYMKDYEAHNRSMSAEQATQLEGINKSDRVLNTFESALADTDDVTGKVGAAGGRLAAAFGIKGSDFDSAREGAATLLARGMEGGTAKPGNVQMLERMMPFATDNATKKASKMARLRQFVNDNREAFQQTLEQGGFRPLQEPQTKPAEAKKPPAAAPTTVKMQFPNGETADVPVSEVKEAKEKFKAVEVPHG